MTAEKHEVLLRLKAIELLAYWEGRLKSNSLIEWFGVSRQQVSSDIKRYIDVHNPDSLVHDPGVKAYVPRAGFQPVLTKGNINEYLEIISGHANDSLAVTLETDINLAFVQLPDRTVRPEVVREVIKACRSAGSLKILYASMNNPTWSERVVSPHTLVYTGFRWHVRAYCHKRNEFRDFLLSRIDRTPQPAKDKAPPLSKDDLWQETITLNLIPNSNLTEKQKALIEKDYGMPDGRFQFSVKKALAHYTLQRFQAAFSPEEVKDVAKYPVQLLESDRKKISPYLFSVGV